MQGASLSIDCSGPPCPRDIARNQSGAELALGYSKASTDFTVRVLYKLLWPKFDTLIRLALAQAYFASGVMKMTRATLAATTHNFPIRFMAPVTAIGEVLRPMRASMEEASRNHSAL